MGAYLNNTFPAETLTVAQLAVSHPGALSVFTKYNIDYCCGGHRSLDEACRRIGLDPQTVKNEIYSSENTSTFALRPERWTSTFLIDYILQNHHTYVKESIPEILQFLDKVCHAHGGDSPELLAIRGLFLTLSDELSDHMMKEEVILFPAIKRLESNNRTDHPLNGAIQAPVSAMEHEHDEAGDLIKQIRSLANNYTPPDFACPTYKITFQKLQQFDNDLMQHIHLENNILFDRVKL